MNIICFGDSLTSCGGPGGRFSDILQDRFPAHEFINAGVGGETLVDARARLETDVLNKNPDIVLIEFGANDWGRNERPVQDWVADLRYLITEIRSIGAKGIVLGVLEADGSTRIRYHEEHLRALRAELAAAGRRGR